MNRLTVVASALFLAFSGVALAQEGPGRSGIDLEQTQESNAGIGNGSEWSNDDGTGFFAGVDFPSHEHPDDPSHVGKAPKEEADPGHSGGRNAVNSFGSDHPAYSRGN